jgi:hypothetical protein
MALRDNFSNSTRTALAKRSGYLCAICKAVTVGPSAESPNSVTNIGVAAHITAASSGGPRYDDSMVSTERSSISNGIWLCQNHATLVDRDCVSWTVAKLKDVKKYHEQYVTQTLGIPSDTRTQLVNIPNYNQPPAIIPREYGFLPIGILIEPYKSVLAPMLHDKGLGKDSELGVLMCGSPPEDDDSPDYETPWTAFVNADWLHWYLNGQTAGYRAAQKVPSEQIYGQIPAWPDTFFEFLAAIVLSNMTFKWQRHPDGYLVLAQQV